MKHRVYINRKRQTPYKYIYIYLLRNKYKTWSSKDNKTFNIGNDSRIVYSGQNVKLIYLFLRIVNNMYEIPYE